MADIFLRVNFMPMVLVALEIDGQESYNID